MVAVTDKIPPRPTDWLNAAMLDHEHAVAKVAVEALRCMNHVRTLSEAGDIADETLRQIEESGWTP